MCWMRPSLSVNALIVTFGFHFLRFCQRGKNVWSSTGKRMPPAHLFHVNITFFPGGVAIRGESGTRLKKLFFSQSRNFMIILFEFWLESNGYLPNTALVCPA